MEMPASWPFTNTGHVPASINRKKTIRVILDETKQNKKKGGKKIQLTMTDQLSQDVFLFRMEKSTTTLTH